MSYDDQERLKNQSIGASAEHKRARFWMTICLVAVSLTLIVLLPLATSIRRHPPSVEPVWLITVIAGIATLAVALISSHRYSARGLVRAGYILSILLSLLVLYLTNFAYYRLFHDFPWYLLILILTVVVIGGWVCRHRWLSILTIALFMFFFVAALLPASEERLPRTARGGGLKVTLQSLERNQGVVFCNFLLEYESETDIEKEHDLDNARLTGRTAGGLLPVECWPPHLWRFEDESLNQETMSFWIFPPKWSRSFNLNLAIPRRVPQEAIALSIPIPPPAWMLDGASLRAKKGGYTLKVSGIQWPDPVDSLSVGFLLAFDLPFLDNFGFSSSQHESRITDQDGNKLNVVWNFDDTEKRGVLTAKIADLPKGVSEVRISMIPDPEAVENHIFFHFPGLPNPSSGEKIE